nr:immunoglobulin heavy chain junction region [Macaca mulatta]MOV53447.1 immunoglobulin heavy chain junction region [Macaca mulatta]MOV53507.1 immunoglobulin heavy chain junction region [Macaca mulatta]MOV53816.1 immunoglobulin heavy chain junction region [Macaca mulatta]MOV55269.1 immunoglobulin heavy chain junction region [Macaca mulatta]
CARVGEEMTTVTNFDYW